MADMPERIVAWYFEHRKDKPMWLDAGSGHGGTEYVRADIYAKELSQLAIESKDRELALARLEGEVLAIRDRHEFLEKALEQAVSCGDLHIATITADDKHYGMWRYQGETLILGIGSTEKFIGGHLADCLELTQYLQEKKEE